MRPVSEQRDEHQDLPTAAVDLIEDTIVALVQQRGSVETTDVVNELQLTGSLEQLDGLGLEASRVTTVVDAVLADLAVSRPPATETLRTLAADTYGLGVDSRVILDRVSDGFAAALSSSEAADLAALVDDLGIDLIGQAFWDLHRVDMTAAAGHSPFATDAASGANAAFRSLVDDAAQAFPDSLGTWLLQSFVAELDGDAHATRLHLDRLLRERPNHGTALLRSMVLAIDEGRFDDALIVNNRLFGGQDANVGPLREFADALVTAGRNDPCPCGSGRKYKHCHEGRPLLLEPTATQALTFKVERFADDRAYADQFVRAEREAGAVLELVDEAATRDLVVHEGGMLERYLDERGHLLPDDEADRLQAWLGARRDLYEIVDTGEAQNGAIVIGRVRTGEQFAFREPLGAPPADVGDLRWMRLEEAADADGVWMPVGVVFAVRPADRDDVLSLIGMPDLGVDDIIEWMRT